VASLGASGIGSVRIFDRNDPAAGGRPDDQPIGYGRCN
jgi:hypothetical protein